MAATIVSIGFVLSFWISAMMILWARLSVFNVGHRFRPSSEIEALSVADFMRQFVCSPSCGNGAQRSLFVRDSPKRISITITMLPTMTLPTFHPTTACSDCGSSIEPFNGTDNLHHCHQHHDHNEQLPTSFLCKVGW